MALFELTEEAVADLESIYKYTNESFGATKAEQYLLSLEEVFLDLSNHNLLGRNRDEVRKGLRSIPWKEHLVFYKVVRKTPRILRVLHGHMDLPWK